MLGLERHPPYSRSLLNEAVQLDEAPPALKEPRRPSLADWRVTLLLGVLTLLYAGVAHRLVQQWNKDPNFSYGYFVPLFSLFVLWENRKRLAVLPVEPAWSGLTLLLAGLGILTVGVMGAELFLTRVSFLFVVAGLTALLWGWNHVRAALFPLCFLLLMIPIPDLIFNQLTSPLQRVASILASGLISSVHIPVLREGNILELPKRSLEVAEACSGIRSLMSLTTLSIIYGYLTETRTWMRLILALSSLPIAVIANSVRIFITGVIVQYWDPSKAEGPFHEFQGVAIFILVGLLLLFLMHRLLEARFGRSAQA